MGINTGSDVKSELEATGKAMRDLAGMEAETSARNAAAMARNEALLRTKKAGSSAKENTLVRDKGSSERGLSR